MRRKILINACEFVPGKSSGIGRVLEGLIDALADTDIAYHIILATSYPNAVPSLLREREKIRLVEVPRTFLKSEKLLYDLSNNGVSVFISPYPKLPLFGCRCLAINTIHDVLDLTHPAYRKRLKSFFDTFRLRNALRKADLTWYDSSWSFDETKKYIGFVGSNPRVRFPGLDEAFSPERKRIEQKVLKKYGLEEQYILVLGNGLPHKNLELLFEISNQISKKFLFVGVPQINQSKWKSRYPTLGGLWIEHVLKEDLPAIMRCAFCVAQPSTAEGYGYPPLEAMACGVPAVVSHIPVLVETTGGNALTADPKNFGEWIRAFEALESDDIYRNQREKGLKWVEPLRGRKGWEDHILDIEELLRGSNK